MDLRMRFGWIAVAGVLLAAIALAVWAPAHGQASTQTTMGSRATVAKTQRLTIKAGKFYITKGLKQVYGNTWKNGSYKTFKSCRNVSRIRVRCGVGWLSGNYIYYGDAYAYFRVQNPGSVYYNVAGIRRKHV